MNRFQRNKRHTYLLLELLLAFSLLSLFLTPLLNTPFSYLKKQRQEILSLRWQQEGEKGLINIEEQLRTGEIPWDSIVKAQKQPVPLSTYSFQKEFKEYEVRLLLARSYLHTEEDSQFGTVHTQVQIHDLSKKKTSLQYQLTGRLFALKKTYSSSAVKEQLEEEPHES